VLVVFEKYVKVANGGTYNIFELAVALVIANVAPSRVSVVCKTGLGALNPPTEAPSGLLKPM
jgi:hypothetical protein